MAWSWHKDWPLSEPVARFWQGHRLLWEPAGSLWRPTSRHHELREFNWLVQEPPAQAADWRRATIPAADWWRSNCFSLKEEWSGLLLFPLSRAFTTHLYVDGRVFFLWHFRSQLDYISGWPSGMSCLFMANREHDREKTSIDNSQTNLSQGPCDQMIVNRVSVFAVPLLSN